MSLGKETYQTSPLYGGGSYKAVDGNTNQSYIGNSCTHTELRYDSKWEVDLGRESIIDHVVIYNRQDCCGKISGLF